MLDISTGTKPDPGAASSGSAIRIRPFINRFLGFIALSVAFFALAAMAAAQTTVYNSVPSILAPNYASLGYQATQTAEFGDFVHLAGSDRNLRAVTITMSDWAVQADAGNIAYCNANPGTCSAAGFNHPMTLNIYSIGAPLAGGVRNHGTLLATVTQTKLIPWRPVADPTCPGGTAWRAPDNGCYNGYAFNLTFDMSHLNVTLPNDVVVGLAFNTQTWGAAPTGVNGPFNSLNFSVEGSATTGSDDNLDNVFWNTQTANNYTDHGAAGIGSFREDTCWGLGCAGAAFGTIPIKITAGPAACDFSENFDGVGAPALPSGWVAANDVAPDNGLPGNVAPFPGPLWTTSTAGPSGGANSAHVDNVDGASDKSLYSPNIAVNSPTAQLSFKNKFDTEPFSGGNFWDGGVLEISSPNINGGAFTDVTDPAVGGSFVTGGYTGQLYGPAGDDNNPLAGRMAWTGTSTGYIDTLVNLGSNVGGQTIKLRFRFGSDAALGAPGWDIDSVTLIDQCSSPTLWVPHVSSPTGVPVTIPVDATSLTGLGVIGADFVFHYNTSALSSAGITVTPGSGLPPGSAVTFNASTPGTITIGVTTGGPEFPGSGPLANIHMNVIGSTGSVTPLTLTYDALHNGLNGGTVASSTVDGDLTIAKATSSTALVLNPPGTNPSNYGDSLTFKATVTSGNGVNPPNGTVTFFDGGTCAAPGPTLQAATAIFAGQLVLTTSGLTAGTHTIVACYAGSPDYNDSGASLGQVVIGTPQTATITNTPATFTGSALTATVTCSGGGAATLTGGGTGTNVGNYPATVDCAANGNFAATTNATVTNNPFVIAPAPQTVTITNTPATFTGGVLTATLSCSGGGTPVLVTGGTGTNVGNYPVTANCGANGNYAVTFGATVTNNPFVIDPAPQTATITNTPQTYTGSALTATVSCSGGGAATLASGGTGTNAGNYPATVDCAANGNFAATTGATVTNNPFVIAPAAQTASVTNSPLAFTGSDQAAIVVCSAGGAVSNILYTPTPPNAAGTYAVTADCGAVPNYSAGSNLAAGNLVIVAATSVLEQPGNMDWFNWDDNANTPNTEIQDDYVTGPAVPPVGNGSARLKGSTGSVKPGMMSQLYQGTHLADITSLSYDTYVTTGSVPYLQFDVDYDLSDMSSTFQGRAYFLPEVGVTTGTWQHWDAFSNQGRWIFSGVPPGPSPLSCLAAPAPACSRADILAAYPNLGLSVGPTRFGMLFRTDAGSQVYVDNFTVGVNANSPTFPGTVRTFNFEPADAVLEQPGNTDWRNYDDTADTPLTERQDDYVAGPATPPVGNGSARLQGSTATVRPSLQSELYQGTRLADFKALSYDAFVTNGSVPYLQFDVDYDNTTGDPTDWQGRAYFLPDAVNVTPGTWQHWDTQLTKGHWFFSGSGNAPPNLCPTNGAGCTLAFVLSTYPNMAVSTGATRFGLLFRIDQGGLAYVDKLIVAVNGNSPTFANTSREFNFEQGTSMTTINCFGASVTYTGSPITPCTASTTTAPVNLNPTPVITYSPDNINVGPVTATATFTDDNYVTSSASDGFTITAAPQTATITNTPASYTGSALTATVTCSGGGTASLTGGSGTGTAPGSYPATVNCTANGNYAATTGATVTNNPFVITSGQVSGTVTVNKWTSQMVSGTTPVNNVNVNGAGSVAVAMTTNGSGVYSSNLFGTGSYTMTPTKTQQPCSTLNGVDSFDSSLVSQHVVQLITLAPAQVAAAKVSGLATLSSFDAALIAQKYVGVCNPTLPNLAGRWVFAPTSQTGNPLLSGPLTQDYTAYMMGDVNGDWAGPGVLPQSDLMARGFGTSKDSVVASVPNTDAAPGSMVTIPLRLDNLNGKAVTNYQFEVDYDPTVLEPGEVAADIAGTMSEGLTIFAAAPEPGHLRVAVYGALPVSGDGVYVNLRFTVLGGVGTSTPLSIAGMKVNDGSSVITTTESVFNVVASNNNASINGRLLTAAGNPVGSARITLMSSTGTTQTAFANPFGFFNFTGLVMGESYTISVQAKRNTFTSRTVSLTDNAVSFDMVADQ